MEAEKQQDLIRLMRGTELIAYCMSMPVFDLFLVRNEIDKNGVWRPSDKAQVLEALSILRSHIRQMETMTVEITQLLTN